MARKIIVQTATVLILLFICVPVLGSDTKIEPELLRVKDMYPGAEIGQNIFVYNNGDSVRHYTANYKIPEYTTKGYSIPPKQVESWVQIRLPNITVQPMDSGRIYVKLKIPNGVKIQAKKWEYWVVITETDDTGRVISEYYSRWLVSTSSDTAVYVYIGLTVALVVFVLFVMKKGKPKIKNETKLG